MKRFLVLVSISFLFGCAESAQLRIEHLDNNIYLLRYNHGAVIETVDPHIAMKQCCGGLYPIDQPPAHNDKAILEKCLLARFPGFTAQFEKGRVKENIPSHVNSHYPLFRVEQNLNLFEW